MSASLLHCSAAHAQNVDQSAPRNDSLFARNRSTTVAERQLPGYERLGIDAGGVNIRADALVGLSAVDNLYADRSNRVGDVAAILAPAIAATLERQRTRLSLRADGQISRFFNRGTESNDIFSARLDGRQELATHLSVTANAGIRRQTERRFDPGAITLSVDPIVFTIADFGGGVTWESGRVNLRANGGYRRMRFSDGRLFDGTVLAQDYRNRDVVNFGVQGDYALTADFAVRVLANYAHNQYGDVSLANPLDRSSRRWEILGGASFEFTDLLRGEVGLGYINVDYKSPAFRSFGGFGGRAQLEYLLTRLTTLTLRGTRTIDESGSPSAPAFVQTSVRLSADHELYRNLILSAYLGYAENQFRQPDRSDRRPSFGLSTRYRMLRNITLVGSYDFLDVSGQPDAIGRSFTINSAMIGINVGL